MKSIERQEAAEVGATMTVPDERSRALVYPRAFLQDLRDPKITPRVPKEVRRTANWLLRDCPEPFVVEIAHKAAPGWSSQVTQNHYWRTDSLETPTNYQEVKNDCTALLATF